MYGQIEDLSQQAQVAAAEKFRDKPAAGPGDIPSTVSQPIQEESEEEEEVSVVDLSSNNKEHSKGCGTKSRVPDQNGVYLLYIMLEIPHSGREPSKLKMDVAALLRLFEDLVLVF